MASGVSSFSRRATTCGPRTASGTWSSARDNRVGPSNEDVAERLRSVTDLDFDDFPLDDLLDVIRIKHEVAFRIDRQALHRVGMETVGVVSVHAKGERLGGVLREILAQRGLGDEIEHGILVIRPLGPLVMGGAWQIGRRRG